LIPKGSLFWSLGLPYSTLEIVLKLQFYRRAFAQTTTAQKHPPVGLLRVDPNSCVWTQNDKKKRF